mmetsp:Transcript_4348/g.5678  ORF Transcript_4348/g.5678 Transcript_4348/m.5678 type:complete len:932 (+) Transcript_4348:113-2908(+)
MEKNSKKSLEAELCSIKILAHIRSNDLPEEDDLAKLLDIRTLEIRRIDQKGQTYIDRNVGTKLSAALVPFCLARCNIDGPNLPAYTDEDRAILGLCVGMCLALLEYYDFSNSHETLHGEKSSHTHHQAAQCQCNKGVIASSSADVEKVRCLVTQGCSLGLFDGVSEISRSVALFQQIQTFLGEVVATAEPMECVAVIRPLLALQALHKARSSVKCAAIELVKSLGGVVPDLQPADASLLVVFLTGCLDLPKIAMESMNCILVCNQKYKAFKNEFHNFLKSRKAARLLVWLDGQDQPTYPLVFQVIQESMELFGHEIVAILFQNIAESMEQYKWKRDDAILLPLLRSLKGLTYIGAIGSEETVQFLQMLKNLVVNPNAIPKIQQYWSVADQCPDFVESVAVNNHIMSLLETLKTHFDGKRLLMLLLEDLNILKLPEYRGSKGYGLMFVNEVCLAISREQRDGSWADDAACKQALSALLQVLKMNMKVLVEYNCQEVEDGYLKTHWCSGINKLVLRSFSHIGLIIMENCDVMDSHTARKALLWTLTFTQRDFHASTLANGPVQTHTTSNKPTISIDIPELLPPPGLESWRVFEDVLVVSDWVTGTTTINLANKAMNTLVNLVQPGTSFQDLVAEFQDELLKLLDCLKNPQWKEEVGHVQALMIIVGRLEFGLSGENLGLVLSLILPMVDDFEQKYQTLGLAMLLHVLNIITPTEISWHKVVIMEVLNRNLTTTSRESSGARSLRYCLACLALMQPTVAECHTMIDTVMRALTLCPGPTLALAYLDGVVEIFQCLPSGFDLVEHLGCVSGSLLPLLQLGDLKQKLATVRCLHFLVLACWPRLQQHIHPIAVGLLECCYTEKEEEVLKTQCVKLLVLLTNISGESLEAFLESAKQKMTQADDIFEKIKDLSIELKQKHGSVTVTEPSQAGNGDSL